jgi:nicotinate-nucleotide adenylyltransferase
VAILQPPDLSPHARPFQFVTMPQIGISSTDIRRRVGDGLSVRYQIPRGVEAYIQAQKLYRPDLPGPDADAAGG